MSGSKVHFQFEGTVWSYRNPNQVYFVTLPVGLSADILDLVGTSLNPWGTVPLHATIDDYTFYTSMFPRRDSGCYDLPLNARVRKRLRIGDGDLLAIHLEIDVPL